MIPKGCDQQGRHPEAAEAATEVGVKDDDGLETVGSVVLPAIIIVVTIAAISLLAGYFA